MKAGTFSGEEAGTEREGEEAGIESAGEEAEKISGVDVDGAGDTFKKGNLLSLLSFLFSSFLSSFSGCLSSFSSTLLIPDSGFPCSPWLTGEGGRTLTDGGGIFSTVELVGVEEGYVSKSGSEGEEAVNK